MRNIIAGSASPAAKATLEKASAYLQAGNAGKAALVCQSALKTFPNNGEIRCLLGMAYTHQGKLKKGVQHLRIVVDQYPDFAKGHEQLGNTLLRLRKLNAAAESFRKSLRINSGQPALYRKLGKILSAQGKSDEATTAFAEAARLDPDPIMKKLADAAEHQRGGRWSEASRIYRRVLRADPNNVDVMHQLATVSMRTNRLEDAAELLRRAVEIRPKFAAAWTDLSIVLQLQEQFDEAVHCALSAVQIVPSQPHALLVLGESYFKYGDNEKAIATYEKGLRYEPNHVPLLSSLGNALRTAGRQHEAIKCYESSISIHPPLGEAYYSLANLKTYRFRDEQVAAMEKLAADNTVKAESRINFHFALGKAFEDREDIHRAIQHYRIGNDMRNAESPYDPKQTDDAHEHLKHIFSGDFVERIVTDVHPTEDVVPIFIVGLPRSGSTLIEQILASHSLVEGTRELPTLGRVVRKLDVEERLVGEYPDALAQLSTDGRRELGKQYLESTQPFRTGKPYFIDKMPNNFWLVGAIRTILPHAKVINACRHPLSTSMSTYKQLFFGGQIFSYTLPDIAHYYLRYQKLMSYWHEIFPGFVLDVHYENLVDDQEAETRRLLEFCGLTFEDSCLRFYETDRSVSTASSEQVRQPIYRTSMDVWRPYEQYLDVLIDGLKPILRELPENQQPQALFSPK
jgi:tetratricopeptide (TPR) repeat protein